MTIYATPDSRNIYCGTGEVWFDRFDSSGDSTGFRHLGDVSKLELTPTATTIEKKSSMNAARATLARANTEVKMELALTLSEFEPNNVALALLGEASAFSQSSASKTGETLGAAVLGRALELGFFGVTGFALKQSSTTYTLGTDYEFDSDSGLVTILSGGTIDADDELTWDGTVPVISSQQVQGLSNGSIIGHLRFRSSPDAVGPRKLIDIWRVSVAPSGALAMIGDAFGEIDLTGDVLLDSSRSAGEQFCRVIDL